MPLPWRLPCLPPPPSFSACLPSPSYLLHLTPISSFYHHLSSCYTHHHRHTPHPTPATIHMGWKDVGLGRRKEEEGQGGQGPAYLLSPSTWLPAIYSPTCTPSATFPPPACRHTLLHACICCLPMPAGRTRFPTTSCPLPTCFPSYLPLPATIPTCCAFLVFCYVYAVIHCITLSACLPMTFCMLSCMHHAFFLYSFSSLPICTCALPVYTLSVSPLALLPCYLCMLPVYILLVCVPICI